MSRTKKGAKGDGYDYWGRRAKSGDCGHGPAVKRDTKRTERSRARAAVKRGKFEDLKRTEAI